MGDGIKPLNLDRTDVSFGLVQVLFVHSIFLFGLGIVVVFSGMHVYVYE